MGFASEAQRRRLWAEQPELARKWEATTPKGSLPDRVAAKPKAHSKPKSHPFRTPTKRGGVGRTLGR